MKHILRRILLVTLAAVGALVAAAFDSSASFAQDLPAGRADQILLEAGIDAYQEGALRDSVETLSGALQGHLSDKQRAEALYFRGLAYRELGMPAQANLDLTGAISQKDGLSKTRLKHAVRNRDGATREAWTTATETVIADEGPVQGSWVPAGPEEWPGQPDPLTTGSIGASPPPAAGGGFVAAIEKFLLPDWP
jgi:hypothetical protein